MKFSHLEQCLDDLVSQNAVENAFVRVGIGDRILCDAARGPVNAETRFDMASVTKIMATTSLALRAMDRGMLSPDTTADEFFPCNRTITVRNMLTHTIGFGHKSLNIEGNTYDNIAEYILNIAPDTPTGTRVHYCCPAFILLGKILERIYGMRLDRAFSEYVAKPLGLTDTTFLPTDKTNMVASNPSPDETGMVNDYNCRFLGGVAGNAGLFSNAADVTKYVRCLLNGGEPLFSERTLALAAKNQTEGLNEARGLGFVYVDGRDPQTAALFPVGSIGHCGHTGQSVFLDLKSKFFVVILSDAKNCVVKKYEHGHYEEVKEMRKRLHEAIKTDMEP